MCLDVSIFRVTSSGKMKKKGGRKIVVQKRQINKLFQRLQGREVIAALHNAVYLRC